MKPDPAVFAPDWNRLPAFVTGAEAVARLKLMVRINRQLAAAVADLDGILEKKFAVAEGLASIGEGDRNAKARRRQLWSELEKAGAEQKIRTYQCVTEIMALLNRSR